VTDKVLQNQEMAARTKVTLLVKAFALERRAVSLCAAVVYSDRVPEQLNVSFHWHILATESKRWPRHAVQVEGKRWTISHGFAVTIKTVITMANAVLTT
jgi:hypothetical protein